MSIIIAVLGGFSCNLTGEPIFRFGFLSIFNCIALSRSCMRGVINLPWGPLCQSTFFVRKQCLGLCGIPIPMS